MEKTSASRQLQLRIDHLEQNNRFINEALEMALSLGDFQADINENHNLNHILEETERRINRLIPFSVRAIYLVDNKDSDIRLALCNPDNRRKMLEDEMDFMTDKGLFAWALRERRGVFIKSKDHKREFFFHVISTRSQIKGLFVGKLPPINRRIPDTSISLLSIILLNTANAIESIETYNFISEQNALLEAKVEERTRELVDYERRLQRAKKMEAIGTLAGGVAHDLNNILSGLVSYPELLLLDIPEDSPLRKPIKTIQKSGEKAATIVQDLLTLARRGLGARDILNLNDIISDYLKSPEFERLRQYHANVNVETALSPNLLRISASSVHISKTVMNLVSNAAESMPNGGTVLISTANQYVDTPIAGYDNVAKGDYVTLTISDNGAGISPGDLERVFEPFYSKKVMGRSGTGLGMAVVWGTVKDHDGYIDAKSVEGEGTIFTVYLPATRQELTKSIQGHRIEDYHGAGENILVVDDVEEQRRIATGMLEKLGYSVSSVASGKEAVEYMKNNSADLLIMDMIMDPGIDGLDTYKNILKIHPGQKAIIASGFSESERVKEAQRLGAGRFIRKPYSLEKIGLAVKAELGR
ncbi:putative Histidine kinase [uncultured Desulfobacterium sp.]|uniref:histidine kinase n=1 Tax=uncultured Desulfobacterium sp. TaxID=201089 RepID=A0A445N2H5_9BACT|nr:putative Histidine kinase [uncultured Desulfobacterium sp.]